ncbi:hypothetical protein THICB1_100531 [Thiomonas arsenitoxydans]|uniref:Uncharacterized protein n=1 Tax=Thiomonas arsenitoxydans (strain DSM 22701 / CIP 110005 / 3As) TaxID=426114 RepID=A0ABP1YYG4_THIA3|nr:hypothetical protein THICB1_100531 [Thiomonas arsenitoxydans]
MPQFSRFREPFASCHLKPLHSRIASPSDISIRSPNRTWFRKRKKRAGVCFCWCWR